MQNTRTTLEQLIEQHAAGEESMPFHSIHGFMTAQAICPAIIDRSELIATILDGTASLNSQDAKTFNQLLDHIKDDIDRSFNGEDGFTPSCVSDEEDTDDFALEDWCTGFMEAHFLAEDTWFKEHEQEVCELLLPVMLASGLFDDQPEFKDILKDEQLTEEMVGQIPEVLMELYLLFNSPEDIRKK